MTWFNKDKEIDWIDLSEDKADIVEKIVSLIKIHL